MIVSCNSIATGPVVIKFYVETLGAEGTKIVQTLQAT